MDGTCTLMSGRGPYDWDKVGEDQPNEPVITMINSLIAAGDTVLFASGRKEQARRQTIIWLFTHIPGLSDMVDKLQESDNPFLHKWLFMRPNYDNRHDEILKAQIHAELVQRGWEIIAVVDDRPSVIAMWRSHGLFVFDVGIPPAIVAADSLRGGVTI